jgi:serine protease Do
VRALAAVACALVAAGCGGGSGDAPSVVAVRVATPAQRSGADATAFAFGRDRVVTVAHVLAGGGRVRAGGRPGQLLRLDRRLDLAVLRVPGVGAAAPRTATAGAGERVTVRVIRRGAVRSLPARVRRTITARVRRGAGPVRVRPALELAADVSPGDSGAPVLDGGHRVVGMIFAQASGREGIAYALDARALPAGGVAR